HGHHAGLLGLAGRRRGTGRLAHAGAHELRQGPARTARARLARVLARPLPERAGRRPRVSETGSLALAERVLELRRRGDELEAVVQREVSGFARFAGSEVHQPT